MISFGLPTVLRSVTRLQVLLSTDSVPETGGTRVLEVPFYFISLSLPEYPYPEHVRVSRGTRFPGVRTKSRAVTLFSKTENVTRGGYNIDQGICPLRGDRLYPQFQCP